MPDAPRHRGFLNPWLPAWLPDLEVCGVPIGDSTIDIKLSRRDGSSHAETTPTTSMQVIFDAIPAPLWGTPPEQQAGPDE